MDDDIRASIQAIRNEAMLVNFDPVQFYALVPRWHFRCSALVTNEKSPPQLSS